VKEQQNAKYFILNSGFNFNPQTPLILHFPNPKWNAKQNANLHSWKLGLTESH
jgi:hypothetical protein